MKPCKTCGEFFRPRKNERLCRKCMKDKEIEKLRHTHNILCASCKKRCKQNALVNVVKCPNYIEKINSK